MQNRPEDVSPIDNIVNVVSCFTERHKSELYKIDINDLANAESEIIKELNKIEKIEEPKGEVEINGNVFKFDKSLKSLKVAQMIDLKMTGDEYYNMANYVMAVLYTNPSIERKDAANLFINDFPINEYEACCRFFFRKYQNWRIVTLTETMVREREEALKIQRGSYSQIRFTRWLRTLTEMLTPSLIWLIVLFYIGKDFSSRKQKK